MDRTIIRALLELTPEERLRLGPAWSKPFIDFERAARRRAGLDDSGGSLFAEQVIDELEVLEALADEIRKAKDRRAGRSRVE